MHCHSLFSLVIIFLTSLSRAEQDSVSNFREVLLHLPPKYCADVPLEKRKAWLASLEKNPTDRLYLTSKFLHWFSDGESYGATSMLWVKQFSRKGKAPLIFVHMAKPFANGSRPEKNQSFVLIQNNNRWQNVTEEFFNEDVDLTLHMRPIRDTPVIQLKTYAQIFSDDGQPQKAYSFGRKMGTLTWDGERFTLEPTPKSR